MAEQPPPAGGQPPPSYQPPPPSNPNPLIPQSSQSRKNILVGINPLVWVGVIIGIVVIAVLLFWSSQQRGADTADRADRVALEQTSTQNAAIFITQTFSAITPTIDPQVAALQTQNALLIQGATDQAITNQAAALQPSQPPVIITSPPEIIVQPTKPPVIIIQPTEPPMIITATTPPQQDNNSVQNSANNCPASPSEASTLIGGQSQFWTPPPFDGAAWVYKNKGNFTVLTYPGFGRLDVWIEVAVSIYETNKSQLTGLTFDEASFHCRKTVLDCPTTSGGVADLIGGNKKYWYLLAESNGTGWKYGAGSPPVTMIAPSFGRIDYRDGAFRNGQRVENVDEATFWCGG